MGRLTGKVAIVTGGSRGVGKAVCLALAREGADVAIAAKTDSPHPKLPGTIHETAAEVKATGRRALALQINVREADHCERMIEETVRQLGRLDILVNNAGAIHLAELAETPVKKIDLMMEVNVRAVLLASRAAIPHMKSGGHIVNMSPPIFPKKIAGKVAYGISKLGMSLCSIGLGEELREQRISVNSLWPITLVESSATINFEMGTPELWRKADVLADATVELCCTPPGELTAQCLYDEDMLRRAGVTDLSRYAVVPGAEPPPLSKALFE